METEHQGRELKSLAKVTGKTADWPAVAKECIAFSNARGGVLVIGIEDGEVAPPPDQVIPAGLAEQVVKRVGQLSVGVSLRFPEAVVHPDGGAYLRVVVERSLGGACTSDGRYYMRVADEAKPVMPEDLGRLFQDRMGYSWEWQPTEARVEHADAERVRSLCGALRASPRVSPHVQAKDDSELLGHYGLTEGVHLTNLGVLWVGTQSQRRRLANAPAIQFIRYDERGEKAALKTWLGATGDLSPLDLIRAIETMEVWTEGVEVPMGMFRPFLPTYDVEVVRELVANALAHRLYTLRGDIFVELHPDRLEIHSPGPLPFGVTPRNILHRRVRRNENLTALFYALSVMEAEGTGYDKVYRILLSSGKPAPVVREDDDRVVVTVRGRDLDPQTVRVVARVVERYTGGPEALNERETIVLGLLARYGPLTGEQVRERLALNDAPALAAWMGSLRDKGVVVSHGNGRATRYSISARLVRETRTRGQRTTLVDIEEHRLRELVRTDVERFPGSAISEIHQRVGLEISRSRIQRALRALVDGNVLARSGTRRWARYAPPLPS